MFQRAGLRFLRRMAQAGMNVFGGIGARVDFLRQLIIALSFPRTYMPLVVRQMRSIGVQSLPLAAIVAAFIGSVIALQTRYQLFPGVQLSVVGLIVRQT